jgi:hypothetical protein
MFMKSPPLATHEQVLAANAAEKAKGRNGINPNSKVLRDYKASLPFMLPFDLFCIVIGLVLGDVYVSARPNGKSAALNFEWGDVNYPYAMHIYRLFYAYIINPPVAVDRINENGNVVRTWQFQTISHGSFLPIYWLFYAKGAVKFVIPFAIAQFLTPMGLAYWFMDDGGQTNYTPGHGQGVELNTQGFTHEEVDKLVAILQSKFGLHCWRKPRKNGKPVIAISSGSYPRLYELISPYVISHFDRKLPRPKYMG